MGAKIAYLAPDDGQMEYLHALAPEADVAWVDSNLGTEEQAAPPRGTRSSSMATPRSTSLVSCPGLEARAGVERRHRQARRGGSGRPRHTRVERRRRQCHLRRRARHRPHAQRLPQAERPDGVRQGRAVGRGHPAGVVGDRPRAYGQDGRDHRSRQHRPERGAAAGGLGVRDPVRGRRRPPRRPRGAGSALPACRGTTCWRARTSFRCTCPSSTPPAA